MSDKFRETAKWLFPWQLIVSAAAAYFFFASLSDCLQALSQIPPYVIAVGEDLDLKTVSRTEFLRHQLTTRALLIAISGYAWFVAASSLRERVAAQALEVRTLQSHVARLREVRLDRATDDTPPQP